MGGRTRTLPFVVLFLFASLLPLLTSGGPVPIPEHFIEDLDIEEVEDGILLLVPTYKVDNNGQPQKREVDYEIVSIPGELVRRTVREVTQAHKLSASNNFGLDPQQYGNIQDLLVNAQNINFASAPSNIGDYSNNIGGLGMNTNSFTANNDNFGNSDYNNGGSSFSSSFNGNDGVSGGIGLGPFVIKTTENNQDTSSSSSGSSGFSSSFDGNTNIGGGSILVSNADTSDEDDEFLFNSDIGDDDFNSAFDSDEYSSITSIGGAAGLGDIGGLLNAISSHPKLNSVSSADLSKILSNIASAGLSAASTGATFAGQAKDALTTAGKVGQTAVVGGTQAVRWVLKKKATGLRTVTEFASTGLQYAGRLSSAVLKVLLRVPGIKAKIISEIIQASQPLATAVSDVIADSADDVGEILGAQTDIFKDAISILFKLVSDVLALKGRVLASFSAGGLDKGATLVNGAVKVSSAFVRTAGDVFSAVGRGVGELVKVASEANIPIPPKLPKITFPQIPIISFPSVSYGSKGVVQSYRSSNKR